MSRRTKKQELDKSTLEWMLRQVTHRQMTQRSMETKAAMNAEYVMAIQASATADAYMMMGKLLREKLELPVEETVLEILERLAESEGLSAQRAVPVCGAPTGTHGRDECEFVRPCPMHGPFAPRTVRNAVPVCGVKVAQSEEGRGERARSTAVPGRSMRIRTASCARGPAWKSRRGRGIAGGSGASARFSEPRRRSIERTNLGVFSWPGGLANDVWVIYRVLMH